MISKELLSKVLNIEIVSYQMKQKNILAYEYNKFSKNQWSGKTFCNRSINIYELAHKCKEWAIKNDFFIFSGYNGNYNCFVNNSGNRFYGDSESESIFKACQWILDNKDSK